MKIYLAGAISGLSYDKVVDHFVSLSNKLSDVGYDVYYPMVGKSYLRTEIKFKAEGYNNPVSTNHAIVERDNWMVNQVDIILVDLTGAERTSIGCMMELAWAFQSRKHSIVVMELENIHRHAFVLEAADIVFETLDEAIEYLIKLIKREV